MADPRVVNASPLVSLAKIGHLDLLSGTATTLVVVRAVADEVLAGPESDPARRVFAGGFGVLQTEQPKTKAPRKRKAR